MLLVGCVECDSADACAPVPAERPDEALPPPPVDPYVVEHLAVGAPQIDLVFVVDNSLATPVEVVEDLVLQLPHVFSIFERDALDYHVGLALSRSTEPMGRLSGWVDSRERVAWLFSQARPYDTDAGYGRETAYAALQTQADALNAGFRRTDAALHVVFVSGQDDLSTSPDPVEFTSWLRLEPPRGGHAHAIVPADAATYLRYVDSTDGAFADIERDALPWESLFDGLRPPRLYLSHLPLDPAAMTVVLEHDSPVGPRRTVASVCAADAPTDPCDLVYEPGSNALDWTRPTHPRVFGATVTYEPLR